MQSGVLEALFERYTGSKPEEITAIGSSGSNRRYFRLRNAGVSLIGVLGTDPAENKAFIGIGRHFRKQGINVPEVLEVSSDEAAYIQEDLGDESLYDAVRQGRESGEYSTKERELLCRVMEILPAIQFKGGKGLDFKICYPEPSFGERMIMFDLNYFKYCFLKTSGIEFNEIFLQDDFERLRDDLLEGPQGDTFMYRDFQARNIMLKDGVPYFIDFQGGRRGPIYYDVASFVWQARAGYPEALKEEMTDCYIKALREYVPDVDAAGFKEKLRLFVLFRTLQVLGAYGFRGGVEKKAHFLESIPFALANLRELLKSPFSKYPYLNSILSKLASKPQEAQYHKKADTGLEVEIYSFSYKKGIPEDRSGNGGGYVFDCRSVHNPGKYEYYRQFTGRDREVIKFLEDDGEIAAFLSHIYEIVDAHVSRFIERGFSHLQVCFGCTGGQHRSVYSAEHLATHIAEKYGVRVRLTHRELGIEEVL